jgi:integrase
MALTDTAIKNAKPRETPYKIADGAGLTLIVNPNGSKWWRLRYRIHGREKMLSLGVYPDVSLKQARERRDDARRLVTDQVDPSTERKAAKAGREHTFGALAREWLELQAKPRRGSTEAALAPVTHAKAVWTFERLLLPKLDTRPIREITSVEMLGVLKAIEARGHHETAHRARQRASQIFRYGVATGRAERDVTTDLRGALAPVVTTSHASIKDPVKIGQLLRAIDGYVGEPAVRYALRIAPLVFVRPTELRRAEWDEFNIKAAEWKIPAEKMKMREPHVVPLAKQTVALLDDLRAHTGHSKYLFPSLRSNLRPISENTVNASLRRMGYASSEMTGHGFRSMASTLLNEQGFHPDWIEAQLAHSDDNSVRAAYNYAKYLKQRRKMMEKWANYLDQLRGTANQTSQRAKI